LGLQNEREWRVFCEKVILKPELADDENYSSNSKRVANRAALTAMITQAFSNLTMDQVIERLENAQIANARVNEMKDVWEHPQLNARNRWTTIQSPVGAVPALVPPGTNSEFKPRMDAVPDVGQHTQQILAEVGLSQDQIQKMA